MMHCTIALQLRWGCREALERVTLPPVFGLIPNIYVFACICICVCFCISASDCVWSHSHTLEHLSQPPQATFLFLTHVNCEFLLLHLLIGYKNLPVEKETTNAMYVCTLHCPLTLLQSLPICWRRHPIPPHTSTPRINTFRLLCLHICWRQHPIPPHTAPKPQHQGSKPLSYCQLWLRYHCHVTIL